MAQQNTSLILEQDILLEVRNISKIFPGVKALKDISFDVRKGEVHSLCGENGAGKSTLIKILTGVHARTSGEYFLEGQPVDFKDTKQSIDAGISCIYQELSMVPLLDVAKNLYLGNQPVTGLGILDNKEMYQKAKAVLERIHLNVSPKRLVADLSVAQQQMVEIGRALTRRSKVIIMDEPTSSLTDNEKDTLHDLIRQLRDEGVSIIYISHKLEDVLEISNRITVIRDGEKIATLDAKQTDKATLISYMIGRTLDNLYNKVPAKLGDEAIRVEGLTRTGVFSDVNFYARHGEVVGFFGLVGAGRSEIMRAVFGVDRFQSGRVFVDGKEIKAHNPVKAVNQGIALVPEDRKLEGLSLRLSVLFNMTLVKIRQISRFGVINQKARRTAAEDYVKRTRIKTPSLAQKVYNLSGGNQQKVVISKWLMMDPKILILDEPTRGIDVAAKAEIYGLISELANTGVCVLVVSSEIPEILGICDRLYTVCEGKITADLTVSQTASDEILANALGVDTDD